MTLNQSNLCGAIASFYGITKAKYREQLLGHNCINKDDDVKFKLLEYPLEDGRYITFVHSEIKCDLYEELIDINKFKKTELMRAIKYNEITVFVFGRFIMVGAHYDMECASQIKLEVDGTSFTFARVDEYLKKFYPPQK